MSSVHANVTVNSQHNLSPELQNSVKKVTVGIMTFPFRLITLPFKLITFPFDLIAKIFHEMGEQMGPKPLNYIIGLPFYIVEGTMLLVTLPFKIITMPFDVIIKAMEEGANQQY